MPLKYLAYRLDGARGRPQVLTIQEVVDGETTDLIRMEYFPEKNGKKVRACWLVPKREGVIKFAMEQAKKYFRK